MVKVEKKKIEWSALPIGKVRQSPENPRKRIENLSELAESIRTIGLIEPIVVRKSGADYELVCGARRLAACTALEWEEIPAFVMELTDDQARDMRIVENLQREGLNPMEEALAFAEMTKRTDVAQLADRIGKSAEYIAKRIRLMDLPKDVQKGIVLSTISAGHGEVILRLEPKIRSEFFGRVVDEKMSVRAAENALGDYGQLFKSAMFDKKECAKCQYNGNAQSGLFDEDTDLKGQCLYAACFRKKVEAAVGIEVAVLKECGRKVMTYAQFAKLPKSYSLLDLDRKSWHRRELGKNWAGKCEKCPSLVFVVDMGVNARMPNIKEKCLDHACYRKLTAPERETDKVDAGDAKANEKRKSEGQVREAKLRFWKKEIIEHAGGNTVMAINLYVLADYCMRYLRTEGMGKIVDMQPHEFAAAYEKMKPEDSDNLLRDVFNGIIGREVDVDDDDLKILAAKLGSTVEKDFVVDAEYLRPKTKDQIVKLSKELGLYSGAHKIEGMKKGKLVEWFLANDLKGKVPKEMKAK